MPPVDPADLTDSQRVVAGIGSSNVIRTLVRHPDLLNAWLGLGTKLLFSERLSPRQRELVVLRVAWRTSASYEWGGHAIAAQAAGLTAAEIRAVLDDTATWASSEAALLQAVDELCADNCVSDATWTALRATLVDQQLIEVLVLTGFYRMNAGILNSLGVQLDPGMPAFGEPPAPLTSAPPETPPMPADDSPGYGDVSGTWQVIFHHPTGDQHLTLVLSVSEGGVSGSVVNAAAGITVAITQGQVDGSHFSFEAPLMAPVEVAITYAGVVHGDTLRGEVTIAGGGSFPVDGQRA
jgi:alkylhydroperoxidase family enzyme